MMNNSSNRNKRGYNVSFVRLLSRPWIVDEDIVGVMLIQQIPTALKTNEIAFGSIYLKVFSSDAHSVSLYSMSFL